MCAWLLCFPPVPTGCTQESGLPFNCYNPNVAVGPDGTMLLHSGECSPFVLKGENKWHYPTVALAGKITAVPSSRRTLDKNEGLAGARPSRAGAAARPAAADDGALPQATVPLYRVFETAITNTKTAAANKFDGVWLNATFVLASPAGGNDGAGRSQQQQQQQHTFWGFYDGGSTWRLRFMPGKVGLWAFTWRFSDGTMAGKGQFRCVAEGASPGVLQPYQKNPHWFAYNGDTPVFLKSYYNKAGGSQRQDAAWFEDKLYSKLAAKGYNHHMASGFLPVLPLSALWDGAPFSDADAPRAINHTIYTDPASPQTSMALDVWQSLEGHIRHLNDHDIAVQFFQGFNAQGNGAASAFGLLGWSLVDVVCARSGMARAGV